jgi:hypothetical protein
MRERQAQRYIGIEVKVIPGLVPYAAVDGADGKHRVGTHRVSQVTRTV